MIKKRIFCNVCILFISSFIFAQVEETTVNFYGSSSIAKDTDILILTQNLFFTQLTNSHRFIVNDLRNTIYSPELLKSPLNTDYVFYMDITPKNTAWTCVLHLISMDTKEETQFSREYPGYYKILMEAKKSISALLDKYDLVKENILTNSNSNSNKTVLQDTNKAEISIEQIAGTWNGEEDIDKIVLLKSGRGFIIYKNGASMSVSVSIEQNSITVAQTTKSNASFFPELPREIALLSATKEITIYWEFLFSNSNILKGTKHTLVPVTQDNKTFATQPGIVQVTWTR